MKCPSEVRLTSGQVASPAPRPGRAIFPGGFSRCEPTTPQEAPMRMIVVYAQRALRHPAVHR